MPVFGERYHSGSPLPRRPTPREFYPNLTLCVAWLILSAVHLYFAYKLSAHRKIDEARWHALLTLIFLAFAVGWLLKAHKAHQRRP